MREIKFRYYWKHDTTGEIRKYEYDLEEIESGSVEKPDFTIRWDIIQKAQYTGLKDKNGKEIYEGDIVQGYYGGSPKYSPNTIEFTNGYFGLKEMALSLHQWLEYDGTYVADIEIIGNIYENPTLINQPN